MVKEGSTDLRHGAMSSRSPVGGLVGYLIADRIGRARVIVIAALMNIALGWFYVTLREPAQ